MFLLLGLVVEYEDHASAGNVLEFLIYAELETEEVNPCEKLDVLLLILMTHV